MRLLRSTGLRTTTLAAAAAVATLAPSTVRGQDTPPDTVTLQPLTVTVLRSPSLLASVPFSASVLAGPDLSRGNSGLFIRDALQGLPGVRVQNRFNPSVGERISIRGFGARSQFGVRGIKILVDGIPATLPDGQSTLDHLDIGSLGRVEALRGPAAALYGNGAGGVLTFRSALPWDGAYRQSATVVAGSDGLLRLQATGSGTAGSTGFRFSVARSQYDGYRTNESGSGEDPYSVADRTTLNGSLFADVLGGRLTVQLSGLGLDALNPGSLPLDLYEEGSNQAWGFNVAQGTFKDVKQGQVGASWAGAVGGLEGTVSAYGVRRELDNAIPNTFIDLDRNGGGLRTAAAKIWEGARGETRLEVGFEAELQSDDRRNLENDGGSPGALTRDQHERVRAAGAFAQLRFPVGGRVSLLGAVRFEDVSFSADDRFTAAGDPDDSGERSMSGLNPSVGAHVDLGDHGVFLSLARSFETPTTTELANRESGAGGFNPDLDPQRGWSVEGGVRGTLADRLAYDFAAFSTRLDDQLIPFEVESAPSRRFFRNAGTSRIEGIEASARAILSDVLSATLSYSWVDARFEEFTLEGEDFGGNRIPGIAPHRVDAALTASGGPLFGEIRLERRGAVPTNDANDAEAESFVLLDLRVGATGLQAGSFRFSPFAGVTNLTDERYVTSVVVNAFGGRYFEPGPDRGVYVGLSTTWDNR